MINTKIVILGSSGFVGQNISRTLLSTDELEIHCASSRGVVGSNLYLDILNPSSWEVLFEIRPNIIIDASGYGIVKNQQSLELMYDVNYLYKRRFLKYLELKLPELFWLGIGSAFEYDLDHQSLNEQSKCFPQTHYGISKFMFSKCLIEESRLKYLLMRPFGMFGPGEDYSKFFPLLINAQKNKEKIALSHGQQLRDYIFVNDFSEFIEQLILTNRIHELTCNVINVGSGKPQSFLEFSKILATEIPGYDPDLWNWGQLPQRQDESSIFYNSSTKASELGFISSPLNLAFKKTIDHYYNH